MIGDIELYPHQEEARDRLSNGKILWGGEGSGKSLTAAAYYMKVEADADVYVITTAKKRDSLEWEGEFAKFGVGRHLEGTLAGTLTVDSWNNIGKYRDVVGGFFIFDEQRIVGSGEWASAFIHISRNNRWILLSATPGDNWLDYIPVFIANGFYKNRTEFKRDHVVYASYTKFPKVERYIGVGKLVRLRNQLLVEMPYTRHTERRVERLQISYNEQLLREVVKNRWNPFENRPMRNAAELFSVMRRIVNSDSSRMEAVKSLMSTHPRLIVFYNFDYELLLLRQMLSSMTLVKSSTPESQMSESISKNSPSPLLEDDGSLCCSTSETKIETVRSSESSLPITAGGSTCLQKNHMTGRKNHTPTLTTSSRDGEPPLLTKKLKKITSIGESTNEGKNTTSTFSSSISSTDASDLLHIKMETGTNTTDTCFCIEMENGLENGLEKDATPSASICVGEWNGHKHEDIPTSKSWVYLVQYTAGAEGWNCTSTDAMIFYSLNYSYKLTHQAQGRIDRLNTPFSLLHYYFLVSNSVVDSAIFDTLGQKRNFNESAYLKSWLKGETDNKV